MKLDRYDGEVPIFSEDYEGRERTIFGSATESNNIDDQFTPEFMRGWGIVGDTEFPTLQDFNALGFTHGKLISYLYQAGIPSYTANEKYYSGSIAQYNNDIYLCTATEPTSLPTDVRDWVKWQSSLGELAQIRADKNGFLLNKAGTYNALIDTDLVQATGQSQTKIMTQKTVTDALAQKQNNLTFVGTGPEVMRKGAYGWGKDTFVQREEEYSLNGGSLQSIGVVNLNNNRPPGMAHHMVLNFPWSDQNITGKIAIANAGNSFAVYGGFGNAMTPEGWMIAYQSKNTRTDKNRVLHAGTGTPINTLNVSDMNQDVIDNDNLTVTSGAVYRALLPKRDFTDNNFTGIQLNLGTTDRGVFLHANPASNVSAIGSMVGGISYFLEIPLKSGLIALTNQVIGINQTYQDVKSSRLTNTTYTNNTEKPIFVSVSSNVFPVSGGNIYLYVNGSPVAQYHSGSYSGEASGAIGTVSAIISPGDTYKIASSLSSVSTWMELR